MARVAVAAASLLDGDRSKAGRSRVTSSVAGRSEVSSAGGLCVLPRAGEWDGEFFPGHGQSARPRTAA